MRPVLAACLLLALGLAAGGCDGGTQPAAPETPPDPDPGGFFPLVARKIREAREQVVADPRSGAAWGSLGMIFHAHRLNAEALACYRQAGELDPGEFRWPYLAATLEWGGTAPGELIDLLEQARARNPDYPPVNVRLGNLLLDAGRTDEARRTLAAALRVDPDNTLALVGMGRIALAGGDAQAALEYAREALWEDREMTEAWSLLVRVRQRQDRPDLARRAAARAEQFTRNAVISDPVLDRVWRHGYRPEALLGRAKMLRRRGRFEEAAELLRAGLEADPADVEARIELARVLLLSYRDVEGIAELEQVRSADPRRIDVERAVERWRDERYLGDRPGD